MSNRPRIFPHVSDGAFGLATLSRIRRDYLEEAFVFLWFLILTLYLVLQREYPYLYDDEYGVLGSAAVLAGYDWATPAGMHFYGFGLSILVVPLYKLALDPVTLYRAVLSVNGLLVTLSAVLAVRTVKLFSLPISRLARVGVIIAAFCYPAVLFYAGLAMGETVLLFCFMLIAHSLVSLVGHHEPKYVTPILLGVGLGLAPYAHARGLVFWLAAMPVFWLALRAKWLAPKTTAIAVLSAVLVAAALAGVKTWLIANFYTEVRSGTGSAVGFMAERLALLEPEQLIVIARVAFGQLAYLMTSSFGLLLGGLVGILAAARPLRSALGNHGGSVDAGSQRLAIAATLVGLSFVMMFVISVIQMGKPVRADHFFYGRYNEVMLPPVLLAALLLFAAFESGQRGARFMWLAAGLILAVLLMLGVSQFPAEIFERKMFWNPLSGWFVHIHGPWKIQPLMIMIGTLIGGFVLAIALAFSRRAFVLAAAAMFTAAALHNYSIQHHGGDKAWSWYAKLGESYGTSLTGKEIALVGDTLMRRLSGEALQFAMPRARVTFDPQRAGGAVATLDLTGKSCNEQDTVERVGKVSLCVYDEALRSEMEKSTARIPSAPPARSRQPARLRMEGAEIVTGGVVGRACAMAANFFYSSWGRYCLPSVTVHVEREGLNGEEWQQLGLFITDSAGNWLGEMRADLDGHGLARNEAVTVEVPVNFGAIMPPGNYTLHTAVVDDEGWDWRSVASIRLTLE